MQLSELLYEDEYQSKHQIEGIEINGIVTKADAVTEGTLFVCFETDKKRTKSLLEEALKRGAAAAVTSEYEGEEALPLFRVKNPRKAYAYLWSRWEGKPERRLRIIGITGTNGKTSTTAMLTAILESSGSKTACIGTLGCSMGNVLYHADDGEGEKRLQTMTTPDPDLLYPILRKMADDGAEYVVMEVSSHALELEKVAPIRFLCGIFTNLSPEHLDFHKNMEDYQRAKGKLFSASKLGFLNADDKASLSFAKHCTYRSYLCGVVQDGDIRAEDVEIKKDGVLYTLKDSEAALTLSVPIPGSFTVYNSLLAASCALKLGVCPAVIKRALESIRGVCGRMERITSKEEDFSIFIDYAHTPEALLSLLREVRRFSPPDGRILLLFGCGGDRDKGKRRVMGEIAEKYADFSFVTADNSRNEDTADIIAEILSGMTKEEKRSVFLSRGDAIAAAVEALRPNDTLLLVGKGHETYEINKNGIRPFYEREIVKELLLKKKGCDFSSEN